MFVAVAAGEKYTANVLAKIHGRSVHKALASARLHALTCILQRHFNSSLAALLQLRSSRLCKQCCRVQPRDSSRMSDPLPPSTANGALLVAIAALCSSAPPPVRPRPSFARAVRHSDSDSRLWSRSCPESQVCIVETLVPGVYVI